MTGRGDPVAAKATPPPPRPPSPSRWPARSSGARAAVSLRDSLSAHGVPRADYVAGGTGLNVRADLGTLNMSDVPVAMIEIGNMRSSGDAQPMTSASGWARHSAAIVDGIRTFLGR